MAYLQEMEWALGRVEEPLLVSPTIPLILGPIIPLAQIVHYGLIGPPPTHGPTLGPKTNFGQVGRILC